MPYEGSKYQEAQGLWYPQIAALIRKDIKASQAKGHLPRLAKYSVRTSTYSGGGSIDVEIRDLPGAWVPQDDSKCDHLYCYDSTSSDDKTVTREHDGGCPARTHLSETAKAALETVKEIWNAYNYSNSDPMVDYFDVHYYGTVQVESPWHAEYRAKDAIERARKRQVTLTR